MATNKLGNKHVMRSVSIRNLLSHKVRLALTVLSVILGTAFVSGAFMFTDTLNKSFESIISSVYDDVDVTVSPGKDADFVNRRDQLAALPDVRAVNESTNLSIAAAGPNKKLLETGGASTNLLPYYTGDQAVNSTYELNGGREPKKDDEVALNDTAMQRNGLKIGDKLTVVTPSEKDTFTIVGTFGSKDTDTGGWAGVAVSPEKFHAMVGTNISSFELAAKDGTTDEQLRDEVKAAFPDMEVSTGKEAADKLTKLLESQLKFINYFLLAFGAIALIVGTFIIANTFSMIVAQRIKEFALLRSLGASRKQITLSVITEATIVGIIGSALGIFAGLGLVKLLVAILNNSMDMGIPDNGLGLGWQSVVFPLAIGIAVTVLSAWAPARRAGRVHPVQAMRAPDQPAPLTTRTIIGLVLLAIGIALAAVGGYATFAMKIRMSLMGVGALGVIIGALMVSAALSIPVLGAFGRVIGLPFGATGKLASTNSSRNPRRTAATAFALTLGLALVCSVGMIGASMKATVSDIIDTNQKAELVVTTPGGNTGGGLTLPMQAMDDVATVDGVAGTLPIYAARHTAIGDHPSPYASIFFTDKDPNPFFDLKLVSGSSDLSQGGTLISESYAKSANLKLNDEITLNSFNLDSDGTSVVPGSLKTTKSTIIGIMGNDGVGSSLVSKKDVEKLGVDPSQYAGYSVLVNVEDHQSVPKVKERIENKLEDYYVAKVMDPTEYKGQQAAAVNQMLGILYGLLALSIVIAVLGIVNTLALSVIERTREIGMLRAVGTLRSQIRHMIYLESVQIAIYGAALGTVMGLFIGWMFLHAMKDMGISTIAVPWQEIIIMFLVSAVVGIAAAIWPGVKAARTNPLEAIED